MKRISQESAACSTRRVVDADTAAGGRGLANPLRLGARLVRDLGELLRYRGAIRCMVQSNLQVRYQRSALGFVWTLLHPLLMMVVLALVFGTLRNKDLNVYAVFLFSGLLPWNFFNSVVRDGAASLIRNERLIRKIYVPKLLFPTTIIIDAGINMILAMVALFLLLQFFGATPSVHLVLLPAGMAILAVFTLGLTLLLMVLNTYFRDITHMLTVILRVLYFGSPILYDVREIADSTTPSAQAMATVLQFNPLTHILEIFHSAFCTKGEGWPRWPDATSWLLAAGCALLALLVGYFVYKTHEDRLIYKL